MSIMCVCVYPFDTFSFFHCKCIDLGEVKSILCISFIANWKNDGKSKQPISVITIPKHANKSNTIIMIFLSLIGRMAHWLFKSACFIMRYQKPNVYHFNAINDVLKI